MSQVHIHFYTDVTSSPLPVKNYSVYLYAYVRMYPSNQKRTKRYPKPPKSTQASTLLILNTSLLRTPLLQILLLPASTTLPPKEPPSMQRRRHTQIPIALIRRSPIAMRRNAQVRIGPTSRRSRTAAPRTLLRGLAASPLGFFLFFLLADFLDAALGCLAVGFADDVHVHPGVCLAVFEDVA